VAAPLLLLAGVLFLGSLSFNLSHLDTGAERLPPIPPIGGFGSAGGLGAAEPGSGNAARAFFQVLLWGLLAAGVLSVVLWKVLGKKLRDMVTPWELLGYGLLIVLFLTLVFFWQDVAEGIHGAAAIHGGNYVVHLDGVPLDGDLGDVGDVTAEAQEGGDAAPVGLLQERLAENLLLRRDHGKTVGAHRRRIAAAQRADQHFMRDQALQQTLRPAEEVRALIHPEGGIEIEHQGFDLALVQGMTVRVRARRIFQGKLRRRRAFAAKSLAACVELHD